MKESMKNTAYTYSGASMHNGNGRKYRVFRVVLFGFELLISFTRFVGTGDDGIRATMG